MEKGFLLHFEDHLLKIVHPAKRQILFRQDLYHLPQAFFKLNRENIIIGKDKIFRAI
jgi:hypothetical protein